MAILGISGAISILPYPTVASDKGVITAIIANTIAVDTYYPGDLPIMRHR